MFKHLDINELNKEVGEYAQILSGVDSSGIFDSKLCELLQEASTSETLKASIFKKNKKSTTNRKKPKANEASQKKLDIDGSEKLSESKSNIDRKSKSGGERVKKEKRESSIGKLKLKSTRKEEKKDNENKEKEHKRKKSLYVRKKSVDKNQLLDKSKLVHIHKSSVELNIVEQQGGLKNGTNMAEALVSLRKKKQTDASYNLRDEIKAASKLKYDSWIQELATPKKQKTRTPAETNRLLTNEE